MNRRLAVTVAVTDSIILNSSPAAANQSVLKFPTTPAAIQRNTFVPGHINRQPATILPTVPRSQANVEQVQAVCCAFCSKPQG
jgi:hypothetical protein